MGVAREPLLVVDDLHVRFGTERGLVYAVNGISFDIAPGETLGIVGESGCGKSVTSLALLGILARNGRVTNGTAMFGGRDLLTLKDEQLRSIRGREIAMIFQDPMTSLNPVLTIGRQIREALETHFGMDREQADRRATELLDQVGIPGAKQRLKDYPHQFSGGMRQRGSNGHDCGGLSMSRGLPSIGWSMVLRAASSLGTLWSRPSVYGCRGCANT